MIELIDLHKSFNGQIVLDGVNLTIPQDRITVVFGKSGVGKSVLLKHIVGLLHPDQGRVLVKGQDISLLRGRKLMEFKKTFAVLFKGGALFDSLNVFRGGCLCHSIGNSSSNGREGFKNSEGTRCPHPSQPITPGPTFSPFPLSGRFHCAQ